MSAMDQPANPVIKTLGPDGIAGRMEQGYGHVVSTGGMSLRQYAAIHLRVPDSGIPELDAMIRQARRQEMVGRALQGLLAADENGHWDLFAKYACEYADAAIKAMEEAKP